MDVSEPPSELPEQARSRPSLLRVLADAGVAPEQELRVAFAEGMGSGERLGEVVVRHGWVDDVGLSRALAQQWGLPSVEGQPEVDHDAAVLLGAAAWRELGACPISSPDGRLLVAAAEPSDDRFAAVREASGGNPSFAIVTGATLDRLLEQLVGSASTAPSDAADMATAAQVAEDSTDPSLQWLTTELDAAIAQLVDLLRERTGELVASQGRSTRELAEAHAELAHLQEARAADASRLGTLEAELAQQQQRLALVRASLADASRTLDD